MIKYQKNEFYITSFVPLLFCKELEVSITQTRVPNCVRNDHEQLIAGNEYLFLSTIFPPDKPLLKGSDCDVFMD
jgi:hypothetical protein